MIRYLACWVLLICSHVVMAETPVQFAQSIREFTVCPATAASMPTFKEEHCEKKHVGKIDPQDTLLWMHADILVPEEVFNRETVIGFHFGAMASSVFYWNGQLVAENGKPSANPQAEKAGNIDVDFFVPRSLLQPGKNSVSILLSSHHNPLKVSAPVHYFLVAENKALQSRVTAYYLPALLTIGALVVAAVYFGFLGVVDVTNRNVLFVSAMAFFAGSQLLIETARAFYDYEYPWQVWRLLAITFCAAGFSVSFVAYLARRFSPSGWYFYVGTALAFALLGGTYFKGYDGKALMAIFAPMCVAFGLMLKASHTKKRGALPVLAVVALTLVGVVAGGQEFLDIGFYFAAAVLITVLLVDQAREMRRIKAAREEMRTRTVRLELELLRRRIAPHFLMNTLNALAEWVEADPKVGVRMIEVLAEEFRLLSQMSDKALVPLGDELALCRYHLEIMSYRVDKAFTLKTVTIEGSTMVPPGILHTLIENAFTHGRYDEGAEFVIEQKREGEEIELIVTVPEPAGAASMDKAQGGEGLAYVRARLEEAFGTSAHFSDGVNEDNCWQTILRFKKVSP